MAILIYALHQFLSGDPYFERPFPRGFWSQSDIDGQDLSEKNIQALHDLAKSLTDEDYSESPDQSSISLSPLVVKVLQSALNKFAGALSIEIGRCFGVEETHSLTRRGQSDGFRIIMRRPIHGKSNILEHTITLAQNPEFKVGIPENAPIPIALDKQKRNVRYFLQARMRRLYDLHGGKSDAYYRRFATREILPLVGNIVMPWLVNPLWLPAFYLPASRTGIMHTHSTVVSSVIASTAALGGETRTPMLSGVLADFITQLIGIVQRTRSHKNVKRDFGKNIEKSILDGSIRMDQSTPIDYPSIAYRPYGWKDDLPLALSSSMVSELAPVVLYLRHVVRPGNVLIIEEPESHLHPGMQVEFTRQIAGLVKAGIRVIVTTHSEWMLEGLANIVKKSELSSVDRGDKITLHSDQVGVWLFKPKRRPKGSVVERIELGESGLYPSGYDDVANALHNEWADTTSRIEASS